MDHLDGFFAAAGYFHTDAFGAEDAGAAFTESSVVVDDQSAHLFRVWVVRGGWATDYVEVFSRQGAGHFKPKCGSMWTKFLRETS